MQNQKQKASARQKKQNPQKKKPSNASTFIQGGSTRYGNGFPKGMPASRNAPSALAIRNRPKPHFRSGAPTRPGSDARFIGCDYIGTLTSSATGAQDTVYVMTPDSTSTFPRLSSIASVFRKYAFNKLRVVAVGVTSSTQAGAMTGAPTYESPTDGATAITIAEARNREGQDTTKLWEVNVVEFDTRKASVPWYTVITTGNDADISFFGEYHNVVDMTSAALAYADLFIEYDVEFCEGASQADPTLVAKSRSKLNCQVFTLEKKVEDRKSIPSIAVNQLDVEKYLQTRRNN